MQIKPFKLERYFAKYEFNAKYLLASSDCESLSIEDLLALEDGAEAQFKEHWLGYTESQGSPALRKEISQIQRKTRKIEREVGPLRFDPQTNDPNFNAAL